MADEAFALSPISARAALPGEEDYAAISEAFMETSRGRWFLTEYAKRNRNADTRMVLDAVARIEQSLVAQKEDSLAAQQESQTAQQANLAMIAAAEAATVAAEAANARLARALDAIRVAVEIARGSAGDVLDGLALEQRQAAVRRGSRVLREIAWRLREIGNDSRICDLIDAQVAVIEKASDEIQTGEAKAALSAAFAVIGDRLAEFDTAETAPTIAAAVDEAAETPSDAMAETAEPMAAPETLEIATTSLAEAAPAEPAEMLQPQPEIVEAPVAETASPLAMETEAALAPADMLEATDFIDDSVIDDTAGVDDEALLDMIAMEMGAPDPIDDEEIALAAVQQAHVAAPEPAVMAAVEMPPQPAAIAPPEPEVSLGSTILASGMLRKQTKPANDPLAPIRRMSQIEKIAFFS